MREVAPGDLIFSFVKTKIQAIGIARGYCYECPKPGVFGTAGSYWNLIGWKVDVAFATLTQKIRPKDHIDRIRPLLPSEGSPLRTTGDGKEVVYLAEIPEDMARLLGMLIGYEFDQAMASNQPQLVNEDPGVIDTLPAVAQWELHLQEEIQGDDKIPETERLALVQARKGQGLFKKRVLKLEDCCRVTRVNRIEHLRASHCRPWRDSSNPERLDGENGLLLTPSIDHLFDRGFISFEDNGRLVIAPVADLPSLQKMGVETLSPVNVGHFTEGQKRYLEYHRNHVFLCRRIS